MMRTINKEDCSKFASNPGSPFRDVFSSKVDKDGTIHIVKTGEEDWDAYIQSHKEQCDISVIIARYQAGDFEALNRNTPMFGDFTEMPKTYAEMLQVKIDADNFFDHLSDEQKKEFDYDKNKFFAQIDTEDWYRKLGCVVEENKDVNEE